MPIVFKQQSNIFLPSLLHTLKLNSDACMQTTRQIPYIPLCRTKSAHRSLKYIGAKLMNSICDHIKRSEQFTALKEKWTVTHMHYDYVYCIWQLTLTNSMHPIIFIVKQFCVKKSLPVYILFLIQLFNVNGIKPDKLCFSGCQWSIDYICLWTYIFVCIFYMWRIKALNLESKSLIKFSQYFHGGLLSFE